MKLISSLKRIAIFLAIGFYAFLITAEAIQVTDSEAINKVVDSTQSAHHLQSWWEKEVVSTDIEIIFGGKSIVKGTFLFEAHGPRARFDRRDGASVFFDGKTAWISPASAERMKGRFHVLTWPWFVMAPFKMKGEGIQLTDLGTAVVDEQDYVTLLQSFDAGMGDTPDDWYRFFINPKTKKLDAMSYIVTYGKDLDTANKKPSIIRYFDYTDGTGPVLSTRYEFWYWDPTTKSCVGDAPKGTGMVTNIDYRLTSEVSFEVPEDARELLLN